MTTTTKRRRTIPLHRAAARLDISERRLRELCELGRVSAVRLGERGHWRVCVEFVEHYERELDRQAAEAAERARALVAATVR